MMEGAGFAQRPMISLLCCLGLTEVALGQIPVVH